MIEQAVLPVVYLSGLGMGLILGYLTGRYSKVVGEGVVRDGDEPGTGD